METVVKPAGSRLPHDSWGTSRLAETMDLADELIGRGLPVGMARIVPHGLGAGAGGELERIARMTTECFAWGCGGGVCGVLFRANLLYELMPVWRRFLARYVGLRVGVAMSGVVRDADELWMATRIALADAHSQDRQLVVLDPPEAAERARSFALLRRSGCMRQPVGHPEEWGDLSLLGRGLLPEFGQVQTAPV